jgi:pimeloyl-ACP methyl ester carboxylesterase
MGLPPHRLSHRTPRLSARIGRWPRRLAALACLVLAAGSALTPPATDTAARADRSATRLRPGEVAVPVPVGAAGAALARTGERIGLVARHGLVADRLRVLSIHPPDASLSGDDSAVVVVAATRAQAERLARPDAAQLLLIADTLP